MAGLSSESSQESRHVVVLGATGSIGQSALAVMAASEGRLRPWALTAHRQVMRLIELAWRFRPPVVVASGVEGDPPVDLPPETAWRTGPQALEEVAGHAEANVVLAAIVGRAGLEATRAAVEAGKPVALANKEALVVAGPLLVDLARRHGSTLIPVDSEHSAVFQAMRAGRREEVERVVLTASGGPFLERPLDTLPNVTVEEALAHPTWRMGPKVTIDSATMMNKALEIVEARWLFDLDPDQIKVVVHPESIVHSMVEFCDGAVIAQLSPPDMRLPIQYGLTYPDRRPSPALRIDWSRIWSCRFLPVDPERYPAIELGMEVARAGGTAGAVMNAANEVAVARFLDGTLGFCDIVRGCRAILDRHAFVAHPTWDELLAADTWARKEMTRWNPN